MVIAIPSPNIKAILDFLSDSWVDMSIKEWGHWLGLLPQLIFYPQDKPRLCEILHKASSGIMYAQEEAYYDDVDEIVRFCLNLAIATYVVHVTAPTPVGKDVDTPLQQHSKTAATIIINVGPTKDRASIIDTTLSALIDQAKILAE
ncbi:MAG: hypothetical protein V1719_01055 [Patescibacteria group bacterium]